MSLIAPVPLKAVDGAYTFINNLSAFKGVNILAISGSSDEYNEKGEVKEWLDAVNSDKRKLIMYDGGHVPPLTVVDSGVTFLSEMLK